MDIETSRRFVAHVKKLERQCAAGSQESCKSLACMALLVKGHRPFDPDGGGEIIDLLPYLKVA